MKSKTEWVGTQEAANIIGVSLDKFRKILNRGGLEGVERLQLKPYTPHLFNLSDLNSLKEDRAS